MVMDSKEDLIKMDERIKIEVFGANIYYILNGKPIDGIITYFQTLKDEGVLKLRCRYSYGNYELLPVSERMETEAECERRVKGEEMKRVRKRRERDDEVDRERQEYMRLKAKFGEES